MDCKPARRPDDERSAEILNRIIEQPKASVERTIVDNKSVFLKLRNQAIFQRLVELKTCLRDSLLQCADESGIQFLNLTIGLLDRDVEPRKTERDQADNRSP